MDLYPVPTLNTQEVQKGTSGILAAANAVRITDEVTYKEADQILDRCKIAEKQVGLIYDEHCAAANKLHKGLTGARAELLKPIKAAYDTVKKKCEVYLIEIEKQRQEAERKMREAAAKAEQERLEAEKERLRAAEKEEAERRARLEQKAKEAEESGNAAKAELIKSQIEDNLIVAEPMELPPSIPASQLVIEETTPKTLAATQHFREVWYYEVVDISKVPREFMVVDEKRLSKFATDHHDSVEIAGVKFFMKKELCKRGINR